MSELSNYLKKVRNEKGFSLASVYKQTGITDSRLCKAENGSDGTLTPRELKTLCKLYEVSVISMYIIAGYIDNSDLEEYCSGFRNTALLDTKEKEHIQNQIDFIINRKDNEL